MDLTARPQPRTVWELLRCCKAAADSGDDDFHNTTSQEVAISTLKDKDLSSTALDSPMTQSTVEADFSFGSHSNQDEQIFNDEIISEVEEDEADTHEEQSSSSSSDMEWHQQSIKAAISIDNNENDSDDFQHESFDDDDASVIFDNLTDFAEQLHQEVDNVVSNVVDALFN